MRKILLAVIAISVTLLLPSCIGLTNISTPHTVALNQGNFKFVKSISAETKATYVFGIGGFKDKANEDVIDNLRLKANLQPNQALADVHVKVTTKTYLGIVTKRTLTASASVVEFKDSATNSFVETPATPVVESCDIETNRESVYKRLQEINNILISGNTDDISNIINEVERIDRWYNSISATYPEIHNILKEIKKLL